MSDKTYMGRHIFDHDGYEEITMPDHPSSRDNGTVFVHTLVAEKKLGRRLKSEECVHHIDGCKSNNDPMNLLIFKTNRDHANYHSAIRNGLDFILSSFDGVCTCTIVFDKERLIKYSTLCPICGGIKSPGSKMCKTCRQDHPAKYAHHSNLCDLDKNTLNELLLNNSLEAIGRMYCVTGNAVKKRAKKFGIYKSKYHQCNDVDLLINRLLHNSRNATADLFGVYPSTIDVWIRRYNIIVEHGMYVCKETGEKFVNAREAARMKYPAVNSHIAAHRIIEVCGLDVEYLGFKWSYQPKNVYRLK